MTDYRIQLIKTVEYAVPELRDKIQAGAVDAGTPAPFATFSTPEEKPIRTKNGIVGYDIIFEVAVYDKRVSGAEQLRHKVLAALEGQQIENKRCWYKSYTTDYYPEYDLHSAVLTFRII